MKQVWFGRKLNPVVLIVATFAGITVNSIGLAREWWDGILPNVFLMLAFAFGAAWLFGRPTPEDGQ